MKAIKALLFKRWRIAIRTVLLVLFLLGVRVVVEELGGQFVTPGPLLTAVVSGGIFVAALVVAGTLSDYKDSERVPAELVAALSSIRTDARAFAREKPDLDLAALDRRLLAVIESFTYDLEHPGSRRCIDSINELSESFAEMDRLEVVATYISRLRGEQAAARKVVLRVYHIQQTEFVPSAYTLVWTIVIFSVLLLTVTQTEDTTEAYVLLAAIYFFLFYLVQLLSVLDTPFQPGTVTHDDVDPMLLDEMAASLGVDWHVPE